jgi:hypothetical protein
MATGSPGPGQNPPAGAADGDATRTFAGRGPFAAPGGRGQHGEPGVPGHAPTEFVPDRTTEVFRYGPGVPATARRGQGAPGAAPSGHARQTAEQVWRGTGPPAPARGRRPRRPRRLLSSAFTVILLATSGVVLYLRLHHPPLHVTGVAIAQQTPIRCGVDVTARISTNGGAGTVSYEWLFQPGGQAPQPQSLSVAAGQQAAYVTATVQGSGQGTASQLVTLQVLGPDQMSASARVTVSC